MKADIIIIGSGPGGYKAAAYAASKGRHVIIFEERQLGGTCLNVGCIPTKALSKSAEVAGTIRNAAAVGVDAAEPTFDLETIIARKDAVVAQLRQGVAAILSTPGITLVKENAVFVDNHTIKAGNELYVADNIVIATGSIHKQLPLEEIDESMVLTSDSLLSLFNMPRQLCIVGAGVIGMEFASIFSQLGSKVTVVEFLKECIPTLDPDISKRLRKALEKRGVDFLMQSAVKRIRDGNVVINRKGKEQVVVADKVLMAVGRRPRVEDLGLENTSVRYDIHGIPVDDNMQTNVPGIYAIGDVNARIMLAHAATMQGIRAINSILGITDGIKLGIIPAAIFTVPEAACVGKPEGQLKADGIDIKVYKKPYRSNGRALAMAEEEGMVKVVAEAESGRILSCHAYGSHSADMVQEVSVLMCKGATLQELHEMVHIHPTVAEMLQDIYI